MKRLIACFYLLFLLLTLGGCNASDAPREAAKNEGSSDDRIDLIVRGDYVVSMDQAGTVLEDAAVAIDENLIG